MTEIHVILLAAGRASRFGEPKQCALVNGKALIVRVLDTYSQCADVTCVLGAHAEKVSALLPTQRIVVADAWESGIAASIKGGLNALPENVTHVCIALADQVAISREDIRLLFDEVEQHPDSIIAAQYADVCGAPAVFPISYRPALLEMQGDTGARSLLVKFADKVHTVQMPGAGLDIDTQADLAAWLATGTKSYGPKTSS